MIFASLTTTTPTTATPPTTTTRWDDVKIDACQDCHHQQVIYILIDLDDYKHHHEYNEDKKDVVWGWHSCIVDENASSTPTPTTTTTKWDDVKLMHVKIAIINK